MLSAKVPHDAYLTTDFSVSDWIASTRKPRTALDGNGATSCTAVQCGLEGVQVVRLVQTLTASGDSPVS